MALREIPCASDMRHNVESRRAEWPGIKVWVDQHRLIVGGVAALWAAILTGSHLFHQHSIEPNRLKWEKWQADMESAFKRTEGLKGTHDARLKAWKDFAEVFAKDNPFSHEDEMLMTKAESNRQGVEEEKARAQKDAKSAAAGTSCGFRALATSAPVTGRESPWRSSSLPASPISAAPIWSRRCCLPLGGRIPTP